MVSICPPYGRLYLRKVEHDVMRAALPTPTALSKEGGKSYVTDGREVPSDGRIALTGGATGVRTC